MAHKRWNCNTPISMYERLTGKLRATLLGNRAVWPHPGGPPSTNKLRNKTNLTTWDPQQDKPPGTRSKTNHLGPAARQTTWDPQ